MYRLGLWKTGADYSADAAPLLTANTVCLSTGVGYADLLHYQSGGTQAAVDGGAGSFRLFIPDPRQQAVYFADFQTAVHSTAFRSGDAPAGYSPGGADAGYTCGLYVHRLPGGSAGTFWGRYERNAYDDVITIASFPHDDGNPALNLFLYDLLEQTFGRRIDTKYTGDTKSAGVSWRLKGWFAGISGGWGDGITECHYKNTEPVHLAGSKTTELVTGIGEFRCRAGGTFRSGPWRIAAAPFYMYRSDSISIIPRNPTPNSTGGYHDLTDLGGGSLHQRSGGVGIDAGYTADTTTVWNAGTRFAISAYEGGGRITTPVLGYDLLIPVAHEFSGALHADVVTQQYTAGWGRIFASGISAGAELGYAHADIEIRTNGRAGAIHNIITTPVDETYRYNADIFTASVDWERRFSPRFSAGIRLYQVIPLFSLQKKDDGARVPPTEPVEKKVKKSIRGGTELSIMTNWYFNRE